MIRTRKELKNIFIPHIVLHYITVELLLLSKLKLLGAIGIRN